MERRYTHQETRLAEAIVITDTDGQIILANCAALGILNPAGFFTRGTTCNMLLAEEIECPHKSVSQEQKVVERESFSRAGDRLFNIRASSIENADGRACGFAHLIQVISEQASKKPAIEIERMPVTRLMMASLAHEISTPLSVISGIAQMLLMNCERESSTALELKKIVSEAQRVADMTRSMLDLVRQEPAQFISIDLADLAHETLGLVEHQLREDGIQVSVECNIGTPPIKGDRSQLQQVMLNLIANAMQAMKTRGILTVRIAEDSSPPKVARAVLLAVEDTGPGISPQAIEKVFDFFFTTKTAENGTGLGLAISKQIIEGHGGTIRAENRESGGARLTVRLPAASAHGASMHSKTGNS